MADLRAATPASLASSQWSAGIENCRSRSATPNATAPTATVPSSFTEEINQFSTDKLIADINIIAAHFAVEKPSLRVENAFKRVRKSIETRTSSVPSTTETAVRQLHEAVRKLSSQVESIKKPLYAAALGNNTTVGRPVEPAPKAVPTRHKREIIVQNGKPSPVQALRTNKEIIDQLNVSGNAGEVVALRKLPDGGIVLTTDDEQTCETWLKDTKWLTVLGEGAKVKRREFTVLAHGVRVSQVQNQEQAITDIYKQNPRLTDKVQILRVSFSKRLIRSGRKTGPLIIAVAEPEQANSLIDAGMILGYELHSCEPYDGKCQITQCFKCFSYGHMAKHCRNTARCGSCGAPGHTTNDCIGKDDPGKHKCVVCRGNHQSWARECPTRKKQVEAAQTAYTLRPSRYQETKALQPQARQFQFTAPMTAVNEAVSRELRPEEEPWITVRNKRVPNRTGQSSAGEPPAKRRGRPTLLSVAAKELADIREYSATPTSTLNE